MPETALIIGVTGQDGAYLSRFLLERGYDVIGTSRHPTAATGGNLARVGAASGVSLRALEPLDRDSVIALLKAERPREIYYLAAQSSVFRSFEDPKGTFEAAAIGLINFLEAARDLPETRLVYAASGDCFGETSAESPANESCPLNPRSPYAAAKSAGHFQIGIARLAYRQFACSALLFNHESALRSEQFAIGKLIAGIGRILDGSGEKLRFGNVGVVRDWGWAPEYVDAMWRMLQQDEPSDFVVATGRSYPLSALIEGCFAEAGLDWRDHVETVNEDPRPTDIKSHYADPGRAARRLGWKATVDGRGLASKLLGALENGPETGLSLGFPR